MNTTKPAINDLAREFNRLFPAQVDATACGWGHGTQAGHIGHAAYDSHDGQPTACVGWYCDGGNAGSPVMELRAADVARACEIMAAMPAARDVDEIVATLGAAAGVWARSIAG